MAYNSILKFVFAAVIITIAGSACKKDSFITSADARLSASVDSVKFDTVFTSVGSITKSFKINNLNNQKLLLSSVKLMGGTASPYKININGIAATEARDIEIAANDSIYVFVSVTVNPTVADLPFVLSDSIQIEYNGNKRLVQLQAYGQNAHFLQDSVVSVNTTFSTDKPYVILGSLTVKKDVTLTLPAGSKIYAHANAPILVDGSLVSNGTFNNQVVFRGDRLDEDYKDLPASWPGIYFRSSSKNNVLSFTQILNAYQAVVAYEPSGNSDPKVTLHKCIIDNSYDVAIYAVRSSVTAENCLISNAGSNVKVNFGGEYNFTNCTIASYGNYYIQHKNPVVYMDNYFDDNGTIVSENLTAQFTNCIMWGEGGIVDDEVAVYKKGTATVSATLKNCLYKVKTDPTLITINNSIKNQKPEFDSIDVNRKIYDFRITRNEAAPGINAGTATSYTTDLDDKPREVTITDIGCYEKQ